MKSIRQIFINNQELLENESVKNLISYTEELEDEITQLRQEDRSKEEHILQMLFDIRNSCSEILKRDEENERFKLGETFNYKECIVGLEQNINNFIKDYNL